jgi:hypothetical protein
VPGWDTLAVVIGGAAGALIGLPFVSVSIRIDVISASPDFSNRGAATLCLFVTVLLVAILLVVPGQDAWELGAELLLLAAGLGGALGWLNRRAMAQPSARPISRILGAVSPDAIHDGAPRSGGRAAARRRRRRRLRPGPGHDRRDRRRRCERMAVPHPNHRVTAHVFGAFGGGHEPSAVRDLAALQLISAQLLRVTVVEPSVDVDHVARGEQLDDLLVDHVHLVLDCVEPLLIEHASPLLSVVPHVAAARRRIKRRRRSRDRARVFLRRRATRPV